MKPIQIISQDLFDKIRSRFQNLEMGDETGAVTIDPAQARFFDFDFVSEDVDLGRVSISLNDLGSLKIYYSQGITENQDEEATRMWFNFLKEMRFFSMRRLLRFDTRDIAKNNLDRNDFQYLATKRLKDEEPMNMNESRWSQKSSRKTSRAVKGQTEVIMRHSHPVEETYPGARSQKNNIKAIFIQNKEGERFKYPFIHPAGAFAMAQHVDHSGVPHDPAGKAIIRMSEQIAQLQEFQRQVRPASLHDDAMGITERAMAKLQELKSCVSRLSKRQYYESWIAEFQETEDGMLGELDDVTMETYKQKFTQSSFNENLAKLFPLIHSIMQETNKVDLEEYVNDGVSEELTTEDVSVNEFEKFEEWVEAVEQGKLTSDQVAGLKQELSALPTGDGGIPQLQLGDGGNDAMEFLSQFGLDDSELAQKLQMAYELDPGTNAIEVLQLWAQENYPELNLALGMSGTTAPAEPSPEPEQPVSEGDSGSMIHEVAKIVKSFYNRDNPEVGPFRGSEGIALDVEKQIGEKFGEDAGRNARALAEKFMEKLSMEWQQRHGSPDASKVDDGGLSRLKELIGNIKTKVEEMNPEPTDSEYDDEDDGDWYDEHGRPSPTGAFDVGGHYHPERDTFEGVAEGLDPERRKKLDDLIDQYRTATDPSHDYYGVDDHYDPEEIIDQIKQEFGDRIASQVEAGTDKMHFPRQGHTSWKTDPLGWKSPVHRQTKAGKMYKQDSDYRKNTIKSRYKLSGKSATEGVAEGSAELSSILKLAGLKSK